LPDTAADTHHYGPPAETFATCFHLTLVDVGMETGTASPFSAEAL